MVGKKSRPYDRACSRICFLAARSSSGKGARVWEAIVILSSRGGRLREPTHRNRDEPNQRPARHQATNQPDQHTFRGKGGSDASISSGEFCSSCPCSELTGRGNISNDFSRVRSRSSQQNLYFFPLPQGQGS